MANVQKYFEKFHDVIRIDYDMSEPLREKREKILSRIRDYLKKNALPGFDELLQGSYKMKTGVKPIKDLRYDIDVGLRFGFSDTDHACKTVRKWVSDAVAGHTEEVEDKGPCTRVIYTDGYHVDLVSYARWEDSLAREQYRLAHKDKGWREADPPKLLEHVEQVRKPFEGTEDSLTKTDQFRRCLRCLRRWNDVAMPYEADDKPSGLALVLLSSQLLKGPVRSLDNSPDDRKALEILARAAASHGGRLVAKKPTPEYEDMFGRLSDVQMDALKRRFKRLEDALVRADGERDPVEACKMLQKEFGADFPLPDPDETGKKTKGPAIIPASTSA